MLVRPKVAWRVVLDLGLLQQRLLLGLLRLRLLELQLIGQWFYREEDIALVHRRAVLVADVLEIAGDPGEEVDRIDRRHAAGGVQRSGDLALHGRRDRHLRGRRRGRGMAILASRQRGHRQ